MNKILICTVGLPRSGKSTWARSTGFPIVNPDSIRLALYNGVFIKEAEPMVWCIAKYMVRSLFLAGHDKVILDATNLTHFTRSEWYSKQWKTVFKVFNTDKETCIQRAKENNQEYLVQVIERMNLMKNELLPDEELYED